MAVLQEMLSPFGLSDVLQGKGKSELYDMLHWGWLQDDVGYIDVHAMNTHEAKLSITEAEDLVHEAKEQVMADLGDASALIVDVRFNEGGYDTVGYAIASWFNDKTRVVPRKKARVGDGWTELQAIEIAGGKNAFPPDEELPYDEEVSVVENMERVLAAALALAARN